MNASSVIGRRSRLRLALCGVGLALFCLNAVAQELEEVVVTAQRREQNIQNVPIAVSAFTAETLQSKGVTDIHSLTTLTPGVNLDAGSPFSGDRSVLSASIRGIGQDDFAFNLNPGVGVYLDGVFLARTIGSNVNLLDVDRVEILKGPQGTLFGANTIGGAISITTHTPGNEARIVAEATGGRFHRRDVSFTADIPIIKDTLLSSITVASQQQDGWQKVIPYPTSSPQGSVPFVTDPQTAYPKAGYSTSDNYGGVGVTSMRGKILWNASDKLTLTLTGDWSHENQTALPTTMLGVFQGNVGSSTFSTLYNLCISNTAATINDAVAAAGFVPGLPPGVPQPFAKGTANNTLFAGICSQPRARVPGLSIGGAPLLGAGFVGSGTSYGFPGIYNPNLNAALMGTPAYLGSSQPRLFFDNAAANVGGDIDTTYANGPDFARNDVFGFSLTGVYTLSDELTLKSITGYRQIKWNIGTDLDGTPETLLEVTDAQHQWQVSQEFQLLGKAFDNKLNYVAGLYYFDEAGYVHDYVPFEGILFVYDVANNVENKNYAAFVHADYNLTDHWGFTVGGRYTSAQAFFLGGQSDLNSFPFGSTVWQTVGPTIPVAAGGGGPFLRYFPNIPDSQSWHIFDPTVGIQYHVNSDVMTYVSWGKGFKAGGWTTRFSAVLPAPPLGPGPAGARYGPEFSKTWELGLKSQWFNRHLVANAAVYYTDYDQIQLNIQQGISPVYTNAGNAKIKGAELEIQSSVGNTGLQLNGALAYIDAYYTSVNANANIPEYALPDGTTVCPTSAINTSNGAPVCPVHAPGVTQLDAQLPKTPKWKVTFDPEYDIALPNEATVRIIPAYTYTSAMFNDSLNTPQLRRSPTHMLDASVHYVSPNGQYDAAFGGTNLTNDRFVTAGSPNYGAGVIDGYYNPPREWYISLRVRLEPGKQ